MKVNGLSFLNGRVTGQRDLVKDKLVHAVPSSNRWSSSEYNQTNAWNVNFSNGNFNNNNKYNGNVVRAVCEYELFNAKITVFITLNIFFFNNQNAV